MTFLLSREICYARKMNDIYREIGMVLEGRRVEIGMSKRKLSELSGITPPYLREVLRGDRKPSIITLISICNAMNIKLSKLFSILENNRNF